MSDLSAKVKDLWNKGKTSTEIAELLGITRSAVMGRVHRMRAKGEVDFRTDPAQRPQRNPLSSPRKPTMPKVMRDHTGPLIRRKYYPSLEQQKKAPPPSAFAKFKYVTLMDLTLIHCRYIMGHNAYQGAYYCGEPKTKGSYCSAHAQICYRKPTPHDRGKKPVRQNLTRFAT